MIAPKDSPDFDTLLDTSGLLCPEPVMMLHGVVRDVATGQVIKVVATDPSTERDIPKFCQFLDHELIQHYQIGAAYIYFIRRG
ncbi:MAG: sulfurtransferase TusA [Cellvibrionales bacterium]|nr:MAG: sulfurtransferase TusA [Cellvibrionales bacterium]